MANRSAVALVGSESLLGREIRDIVATAIPNWDLRLIATEDEAAGRITRVGDEPAIVVHLNAASLADAQAVFLAGSAASSLKALELAVDSVPVIDLTYAAEDRPDAQLRAPLLESANAKSAVSASAVSVIAHPAAVALALFLRRLHARQTIRRSVIQIFAPASEHGMTGVEELQQQTVNLLSFKPLPQAIFDTQLGFTMLARYGEEAPVALEQGELRIERHLASLLALDGEGACAPMPSLRLIQAPVFHGYSFSAWVEFETNPTVRTLTEGLASDFIDVRGADLEPPTNVGQAGQSGISVGGIVPDRNDAKACWFWLVADNLRLMAENAVGVAARML